MVAGVASGAPIRTSTIDSDVRAGASVPVEVADRHLKVLRVALVAGARAAHLRFRSGVIHPRLPVPSGIRRNYSIQYSTVNDL